MIFPNPDPKSPRVNITGENRTLKQLLTEPYRVQKKKGYKSLESLRQDVLSHISKFRPDILDLSFSRFMEMANYNLEIPGMEPHARELVGGIYFFLLLQTRPPIFYLDKDLMSMLSNTIPPDNITIDRIFLPSFLLLMPNNSLVNGIFFRVDKENNADTLFSTMMISGRAPCSIAVMKLGKSYSTYPEQRDESDVSAVTNMFNNFLLWQQSMHDKGEEIIELDAPTRKMGFGKNTKQIIVPKVIGEGYKPKVIRNYEPTGTHASPRTHWRSGHWRQQPYGKKDDPKLKTIWLEPVLVNG